MSGGAVAAALGMLAAVPVLGGCGAQDGASAAGTQVPTATNSVPATTVVTEVSGEGDRIGLPCPASAPDPVPVVGGLPDVSLTCLGPGPDVNLAGLAGRPVVLNIWASWCPPCRAEMPLFADLAQSAGNQLTVLGVDVQDDRTAGMDFAAKAPIASVFDPSGSTRVTLGWSGPPVTLFVTAEGKVAYRQFGAVPDEATLRALVRQHLGVEVPG